MMKKIRRCLGLVLILMLLCGNNVNATDLGVVEINGEGLAIQEFTVNPLEQGYAMDTVELTASAIGGSGSYQYRFFVIRNDEEILLQDFSEINTYTWRPYTVADYEVCVEVRDSEGESVVQKAVFSVIPKQLEVDFVNINPEYSVETRGTVEISAQALNNTGEVQYCFFVIRDGRKIILQDYSVEASCVWKPYTVGRYQLGVEVIDLSGNYATTSIEYEVLESSLDIQEFTIAPAGSAAKNTTVEINATASGGSGEYQYSYYVIRDGREILLRDYDKESTYVWRPYTPAVYQVGVRVKDYNGNIVVREQNYKINNSNLKIDSLKTTPEGQASPGENVTITAQATEGQGEYQYRFYVVRDGREINLQSYSTENICVWKPYTRADYTLCVEVMDEAGSIVSESIPYRIQEPELRIDSLEVGIDGKVYVGETLIKAEVSGGSAPYSCQFYAIRNNNPDDKIILKDFSEDLEKIWKPYTLAQYEIFAVIRDALGTEVVKSTKVEVVPATLKINSFNVGNNKKLQAKQTVQMTVDYETYGDIGELEYKYYAIRDGREIVLRDYSPVLNATWRPITTASYEVWVEIKDKNGNIYKDSLNLEVIPQELYIDNFTVGAEMNIPPYTKVPLSVQAHGGTGKLQYRFYVIRAGQEILLQDFSEKAEYEWVPYTIAGYKVCVDVKDENGLITTATQDIYVIQQIGHGIDVSVWNGNVDWNRVKQQDIDFAMIRVGYGKEIYQKDEQFERNYTGAKNAGLRVGVYHYSYAKTEVEARLEAKVVLQWLNGRQLDLPVAFDIEEPTIHNGMNKKQATALCVAFCDEIRKGGYTPMIYSMKNYYDTKFDISQISQYKNWIASWYSALPEIAGIHTDMWQYSATGNVPGANTGSGCDMNYSYGL